MGWFSKTPSVVEVLHDHYERQIALFQEQLTDARGEAQRHCERADRAVDELVKLYGLNAISNLGQREAAQRAAASRQRADQATQRADLMFEEVPFGDPRGRYAKPEDAALDTDEAEAPLPPLAMFLATGKEN